VSASPSTTHLADSRTDSFLNAIASGGAARACIVLTVLCALLYLPGLTSIPPTDRDDARFMQATKQMIETGDYINIHFQDEPRNKKPAGIHWLQAAAVKIAGQDLTSYWAYRLPSVVAAWLAVIACYAFGARLFDRKTGFISGAVLATSFMVVIEAHIAKTDATLLAATTVAMGALALMYTNRHHGPAGLAPALMFWIALAASTLIKGPVSLALVFVTIVALGIADRDIRWLKQTRPLIGLPLALAITLPWLLATSGNESGNNFLVEAVRGDLIPKLIGGQESHGAPPGAHLLAGFITAWPWSLLLPFAILLGWRQRTQPVIRFCLAWLIGTWALFEVVPTKLPHYTLPAFPAAALLIAAAVQSDGLREVMRSAPGRV
jgi:4-amino-4-deoxy-L-arabinose transferase-like glycosyltransferase